MDNRITCVIPFSDEHALDITFQSLKRSGMVGQIVLVIGNENEKVYTDPMISYILTQGFNTSDTIRSVSRVNKSDYILVYSLCFPLDLGKPSFKRMIQVCEDSGAGMVYSDYFEKKENKLTIHPVIDYQEGSLRDDFNFGSVVLYKASAFTEACTEMD
jgi:hypothetical protein